MRKLYIFRILSVLFLLAGAISCENLDADRYGSQDIPDGETTLSATINLNTYIDALDGNTKSSGEVLKNISNLNILIYDKDGKYKQELSKYLSSGDMTITSVKREPQDTGTDLNNAEEETPRASFKLDIPFGVYSMYAVANTGDITKSEDVETIDRLKGYNLIWKQDKVENPTNIGENAEMFGHFTAKYSDGTSANQGEQIIINRPGMTIHTWLERAASKVTVAFNGANLNENVYITIHSVQIKDIPATCPLANENKPQSYDNLFKDLGKENQSVEWGYQGERISYKNSDGGYPVITKGGVNYGSTHVEGWLESDGKTPKDFDPNSTSGKAHLETSPALYFYENLQGLGEQSTSTDKSLNKLEYLQKGKEYGSYIEVKGYYENKNLNDVSSGEIIYRFMLGMNETTNYNAKRNHHYKLTLCFNNDANDVDWRIEYDENIGIYAPNPYYISYLYSQSMEMPLKVVIDKDDEITSLKAEIIENNWEPDGSTDALGSDYYGNNEKIYYGYGDNSVLSGTIGAGNTNMPWLGFLSLRDEYKLNGSDPNLPYVSTADYIGTNVAKTEWDSHKLGIKNDYISSNIDDTGTSTKSVSYNIPFFTRVKILYAVSGYVGNNPFVGYSRKAKVKFSVTTKNNAKIEPVIVDLIQVKRVVNPSGIWRRSDNTESFDVTLMEQDGYGGDFHPIYSDGPWSVETIPPQGSIGSWFSVSQTSGKTGSRINFIYQPNSVNKDLIPRCGYIHVKYNNNTCSHIILVRQGYEPIAIDDNSKRWFSFNMLKGIELAGTPVEEGSLFRWGKNDYPISEQNNMLEGLQYGESPGDKKFIIEGGSVPSYTWSQIGSFPYNTAFAFGSFGGLKTKLPTVDDWNTLKTKHLQNYGVLYADGATTVANTTSDAFGYRRHAPNDVSHRGMRGVFAYNANDGRNIFFPIGALGHGHRKQEHTEGDAAMRGILRYATSNKIFSLSSPKNYMYRPLFYDLYSQPGAIYWTSSVSGTTGVDAWDINYFQLNFDTYTADNAWYDGTSDACFVRLVVDE